MKPDSNNPGSFMPAQNAESLNVIKNSPDNIENSSLAASQNKLPNPPTEIKENINHGESSKPDTQAPKSEVDNSFEAQLSQMPAEDTDIIEKEWVDKVDHVIETTSNDPYFQEQGQHALARHYLKSRFNQDVK
jgi:hypothetical protein